MENVISLEKEELEKIVPGEAITTASIMAVLLASIIVVIVYRLFMASSGNVSIPGGFKFSWK